MTTKTNKFKLMFFITSVITVITVALRTVAILTSYETGIGYYQRGAILPYFHQALLIGSIIFIVVFSFLIKKNTAPLSLPAPSHISIFASFLCGTLQISSAVLLLLFQRGSMPPVTLAVILGFAFATVYFFYDALCPPAKKSPLCIIPAMAAVIGLVAVIVKVHLDYTVTLNNPNKTLIFITFATVSLYMVQELRFIVGKPQPRLYAATASLSMLMCAALSIPGIIGHYTNVLSGGDFLIYYVISFGYAVYIFIRLFIYTRLCSVTETFYELRAEAVEQ